MKIKNILEITIKELKSFYDNTSGYLLSGIFLALLYFLFLKPFFISQTVSLRDMFQWMPWLFIVFIPAITMGSFAKEYENQTIEYLLSKPLEKKELIIGKILGSFLYIYITILLTTPLIFFISRLGKLDYSETAAGYFGLFLLALTLSAIGVGISSMIKNQITAFIVTVTAIFALTIIGSEITAINLSSGLAGFLSTLSISDHFYSLARGVLKASDLAYFLIIIVFSIGLTEYNLNKEKGIRAKGFKNNTSIFIWLSITLIGIVIVSKYMYGRIDLTSNKKYTLTTVTKSILKNEGKITVEVYASNNLPPQFKSIYEEVKNILDDYKAQGGSNFDLQYINPEGKEVELQQKGISPVEFRVYGNDQLQAQKGYLAIYLKNETGQDEAIPAVQNVNELEYDLSNLIYRLKNVEKSKIAFASGNGERSNFDEYSALSQYLGADYEIGTAFFPSSEGSTPEQNADQTITDLSEYKILVIANPLDTYTNEGKQKIKEFIDNGGNVIYLAENVDVNNETAAAEKPETPRGDLFADYGATVNQDLLYDVRNHGMISIQTGQGIIPVNYPFFAFAQKTNIDIKNLPDNILIGWGSTLTLDNNWKVIYQTSPYAGVQTDAYNVNPTQEFPQENLKSYPVVAVREFDNGGKVFIISNAKLFDNQFIGGVEQNAVFALRLFEEAFRGVGLSSIKAKTLNDNQMNYVETSDKNLVNYGAPTASLILLAAIGYARYRRKQNLIKHYAKLRIPKI